MEQHDQDGWRYAQLSMRWYGWGSPIGMGFGFGAFLLSIGGFIYLLHLAGLVG